MDNRGSYLLELHDFIVSKVRQKLSRWDVRRLSLARCITLARLVLLSIPNYFMYTVRILVSVCMEIEKTAHNFMYGSSCKDRRVALLSWDKCCQPLNNGGLGIRRLTD